MTMLDAGEKCFCGAPATRTLGNVAYCAGCAETVLAPLRARHPSSGGHGRQSGPLRPDWGEGYADLQCDHCGSGWVGPIGETCAWCVKAIQEAEPRRLELIHPARELLDAIPDLEWHNESASSNGHSDWDRHDLAALAAQIAAGNYTPEIAEYLAVEGGMPLLYPGRTHSIFGEPGGGKTWIALYAVAERLQAGEPVLLIDWEDSPQGTAIRLLGLGCTPDDLILLDYRNPVTGFSQGWQALETGTAMWTLVVIDSTGEAMGADGIKSNDDTPVTEWMGLAKRLARTGAAVLLLDHVPKNVENRDMEIGSQRKQASITGASYRCDTVMSPAKGKDGLLKLIVRKDRLGNRPKGSTAAEVHILEAHGPLRIELRVSEAQAAADRGEKFRPTHLMERVSRWLEFHPGSTRRMIETDVVGNRDALRTATDTLVEEGYVSVTKVGRSHEHTSIRNYREEFDGLITAVDNSTVPIVPNRALDVPKARTDVPKTERAHRAHAYTETHGDGHDEVPPEAHPQDPTCPPVHNPLFDEDF